MIQIAIVEDNIADRKQLQDSLARYSTETGNSFHISLYYDGIDFVEEDTSRFDLIFLDIQMTFMDGILDTYIRANPVDISVPLR